MKRRQLLPVCPLFLLVTFTPGVICRGRVQGFGRHTDTSASRGAPPQRHPTRFNHGLFLPDFEAKTEELRARLLKKRRLQEDEALGDTADESPANLADGCSLCEANTLLSDKIPNQNILRIPPYDTATCLQWQDDILPILAPGGKFCRSQEMYQFLFVSCCQLSVPRYQCEANVHNLLAGVENYNTAVPPIVSHDEPLVVYTDIIFAKVDQIDVMSGSASISVIVTMKWHDPRLAWTIDKDTYCVDYVDLWTGYNVEDTVIWVPDIDLVNQISGFQDFSNSLARVSSDGIVQWTVFGSITATCTLRGIANIPFDILGCQLLFGARTRTDANMVAYRFADEATIEVADNEVKYEEFTPRPDLFEKGYTLYLNKDYATGMYYNFYFERARNFYVMNVVVPHLTLTYCSFGTFLLDMRVGERLSFVMAIALVVIATQIVTFELVPVSSSKLWIDRFVGWSFYWVFFVLLQSVGIAFMSVIREDRISKTVASEEVMANTTDSNSHRAGGKTIASAASVVELETEEVEEDTNSVNDSESFFWSFSLRKFDFICLAFCVLSYTVFVVFMFISTKDGSWVRGEPKWFTPETTVYFKSVKNNHYNTSAAEL